MAKSFLQGINKPAGLRWVTLWPALLASWSLFKQGCVSGTYNRRVALHEGTCEAGSGGRSRLELDKLEKQDVTDWRPQCPQVKHPRPPRSGQ